MANNTIEDKAQEETELAQDIEALQTKFRATLPPGDELTDALYHLYALARLAQRKLSWRNPPF